MQPWYAQKATTTTTTTTEALAFDHAADRGQPIAVTAGTDLLVMDTQLKKHKHKKDRKKRRHDKDKKQPKPQSVHDLRAERQAREDAERLRQNRLLHQHQGVARPR